MNHPTGVPGILSTRGLSHASSVELKHRSCLSQRCLSPRSLPSHLWVPHVGCQRGRLGLRHVHGQRSLTRRRRCAIRVAAAAEVAPAAPPEEAELARLCRSALGPSRCFGLVAAPWDRRRAQELIRALERDARGGEAEALGEWELYYSTSPGTLGSAAGWGVVGGLPAGGGVRGVQQTWRRAAGAGAPAGALEATNRVTVAVGPAAGVVILQQFLATPQESLASGRRVAVEVKLARQAVVPWLGSPDAALASSLESVADPLGLNDAVPPKPNVVIYAGAMVKLVKDDTSLSCYLKSEKQ